MFCQKCGAELTPNALFCIKCGNKVPVTADCTIKENGKNEIRNVREVQDEAENEGDTLTRAVMDFQKGDLEAFDTIYNESKRYVYYTILKTVGDKETSDDILQETYLEVYKSLGQLQNPAVFKVWAARIAQSKISRYFQKRRPELFSTEEEMDDTVGDLVEEDMSALPEDAMINKEVQRLISEIIDDLPQNQKSAVVSYYYNQMTIPEIAQAMGIPENTVKTYLFRGKKKLKDEILEIEKKHGTKLYALPLAGLLGLLFTEEAKAATISTTASQMLGLAARAGGSASSMNAVKSAGSYNDVTSTKKILRTASKSTANTTGKIVKSSIAKTIIYTTAGLVVGSSTTAAIMHRSYEKKMNSLVAEQEYNDSSESMRFDFGDDKENVAKAIRDGHYVGYTSHDFLPWIGSDFYFSNGQWRTEDDKFGTEVYQYTIEEINGESYLHYWNSDNDGIKKIKIDDDVIQIFDDNYLEWHTFRKE